MVTQGQNLFGPLKPVTCEASHVILLCSLVLGTSQGCVRHRLFTLWEGIEQVPLEHLINVRQDLIR